MLSEKNIILYTSHHEQDKSVRNKRRCSLCTRYGSTRGYISPQVQLGDWWGARWNRGKLEEWTVWIVMRAWSIIYCDEQATQSDYEWAFPQERVNSDILDTKTDVMFAFAAFSSSITICTPSHNKLYHLFFPFLFLRDILRFVSVLQNIPICSNCLQWADEDINQICKYETV